MDCNLPGSSVHGDSPGKNTGVGCHALFQGIFLTQGSNLCLMSPELTRGFLPLAPPGKPNFLWQQLLNVFLKPDNKYFWLSGHTYSVVTTQFCHCSLTESYIIRKEMGEATFLVKIELGSCLWTIDFQPLHQKGNVSISSLSLFKRATSFYLLTQWKIWLLILLRKWKQSEMDFHKTSSLW